MPNEQLSLIGTLSLDKDNGVFSQEPRNDKIVVKKTVETAIPPEFTSEVCIKFYAIST